MYWSVLLYISCTSLCTKYVPVRTDSEPVHTKYPIPVMRFTIPDGVKVIGERKMSSVARLRELPVGDSFKFGLGAKLETITVVGIIPMPGQPEWSCAPSHSTRPRCHRTKRHRFGLYPASRTGPSGLGDVKPTRLRLAGAGGPGREMIRGRPKLLPQHDILSIWYYRYHMVLYAISVYRESMIDIAQSTCRLLSRRAAHGRVERTRLSRAEFHSGLDCRQIDGSMK